MNFICFYPLQKWNKCEYFHRINAKCFFEIPQNPIIIVSVRAIALQTHTLNRNVSTQVNVTVFDFDSGLISIKNYYLMLCSAMLCAIHSLLICWTISKWYNIKWKRLIPLTFICVFAVLLSVSVSVIRSLVVWAPLYVSNTRNEISISYCLLCVNICTNTYQIWSGQAHGKICKKHLHQHQISQQSGQKVRAQRW